MIALTLTLCLALPLPAQAQGTARPLRLGIYHPLPRFCATEFSQRDIRVIRFIFALDEAPRARLGAPWFYRPAAGPRGNQLELTLDTATLWGFPPEALHVEGGARPAVAVLAPWHRALARALPNLRPADSAGGTVLRLEQGLGDPFALSRLHARALLPRYDLRAGAMEDHCVQWPLAADVRLDKHGYEVRAVGLQGRPPYVLRGYVERARMWNDLRRGRVQALLLEAGDDPPAQALAAGAAWRWGAFPGTQQIVLRLSPAMAQRLGAAGRAALSRAVDRAALASASGLHDLAPAGEFMHNIGAPPSSPEGPLHWNTRDARRQWLAIPGLSGRLSLTALEHPQLGGLAHRLASQLQRTLNLQVSLRMLPLDNFAVAAQEGQYDLLLDVMDLEDGSLQDLWRQSLAAAGADTADMDPSGEASVQLQAWETALQAQLPYLPLLVNVHHMVSAGRRADEILRAVCPGCERLAR